MRLLDIQSSPRGESFDSIAHTKPFIEANQIRQHLDSCGYVAELRLRRDMFGGTYKTRGVVSRRHRG